MTVRLRRDKGRWRYRFQYGGVRHAREGYSTRDAAQAAETAHRLAVGATLGRRRAGTVAFQVAVERYTAAILPARANPRGPRFALTLMAAHWGERLLTDLTGAHVRAFLEWRAAQPTPRIAERAPDGTVTRRLPQGATLNRDVAALSAFYRWAATEGLVPYGFNPTRGIPKRAEPWRPWIVLTPAQERALWAGLPLRFRRTVQLLEAVGVRRGVIVPSGTGPGLQWEQIDWRHRLLHLTSKGKSLVLPLNATACRLLRQLGPRPSGPVFRERSDISLRRAWARARNRLGLPDLRLHDLRVLFARRLDEEGYSLKTIQALLGHATPTMTLRYIPTNLGDMRRAVRALDRPRTRSGGGSGGGRRTA